MKSFVLDTNAFLRFFLNDIDKQAEDVKDLFLKAQSKKIKILVPQIIIFEIEFALDKYYKFPKLEVMEKLASLLSTSYLEIQDRETFQEALEIYKEKNLDFVDCFLLASTKLKNFTMFTFDKKLLSL